MEYLGISSAAQYGSCIINMMCNLKKCRNAVQGLLDNVYHVVGQRFLQYRLHRPHFFTPELQFDPHINMETCLSVLSDKNGSSRTALRTSLIRRFLWQQPSKPAIQCQGNNWMTVLECLFLGITLLIDWWTFWNLPPTPYVSKNHLLEITFPGASSKSVISFPPFSKRAIGHLWLWAYWLKQYH